MLLVATGFRLTECGCDPCLMICNIPHAIYYCFKGFMVTDWLTGNYKILTSTQYRPYMEVSHNIQQSNIITLNMKKIIF